MRLVMAGGKVITVDHVQNKELLPHILQDDQSAANVNQWLQSRRMPAVGKYQRDGIENVRKEFDWNLPNGHMMSLSDHYWLKRKKEEKYEDLNYFEHPFPPLIGEMFFSPWTVEGMIFPDVESPDITCGGRLRKRWIQSAEKNEQGGTVYHNYLHKGGSVRLHQYPLVEVIVSELLRLLDVIPYVSYTLTVDGLELCSECEDFVTMDSEFVPAAQLVMRERGDKDVEPLSHLFTLCEKYKIPDYEEFLRTMIAIDGLIGNTDRNYNNFGFLRNPNTGDFIGPAPLFDHGSCMFQWDNKKKYLFRKVQKDCLDQFYKKYGDRLSGINESMGQIFTLLDRYPMISEPIRQDIYDTLQNNFVDSSNRNPVRDEEEKQEDDMLLC